MHNNLIVILGPTAVGKTKLAAELAYKFNGEIISADSRQVYRGMDIGTGKDLADYIVNGCTIPYHLVDVIDPSEEFNLFLFQELFFKSFSDISSRKKIPILAGGTGLYIHSVLKNYSLEKVENTHEAVELENLDVDRLREILVTLKPVLHNTTDMLDKDRLVKAILIARHENKTNVKNKAEIIPLVIGVRLDREEIKKRITARLKDRLNNGMIEEVKILVDNGITYEKLNFFGLEYKFVGQYLQGILNYNDMYQKLNSAIHDFAKRQMTWFRKMEKEGIVINWIEGPSFEQAASIIEQRFYK